MNMPLKASMNSMSPTHRLLFAVRAQSAFAQAIQAVAIAGKSAPGVQAQLDVETSTRFCQESGRTALSAGGRYHEDYGV